MTKLSDDELKNLAQKSLSGEPEVGSIYQHYKGGLYVVVAQSIKEDTLEPLVTYRSNAHGTFWTRTLANFMKEDNWGPQYGRQPRFKRAEG